ncbi:MAG: hypothetical protein ACRYFV_15620 [Janthinobacterium lividum]
MPKLRFCLLLLLTLLLKSCEVPDVQPFIKATSEMGIAIDAGLKQVLADLKKVSIPDALVTDTEARRQQVKKRQGQLAQDVATLETQTKAFTKVAHGFDTYATALDDVVASGKKQGAQVEKVAQTLLDLAAAAKAYTGPIGSVAEPAIKLLDAAIKDLGDIHTINKLSKLASPKQDTLVQRTARVLRLGLKHFDSIDKDAQALVEDYKPKEDVDLENLYQNAVITQKVAISRLASIKLVENDILNDKKHDLKTDFSALVAQDKPLTKNHLPKSELQIALDDITALRPLNTTSKAALFEALAQRREFYIQWFNEPQMTKPLYEAEQAHYVQNSEVVAKSQKAVTDWANAHQTLRVELLKSLRVKTADFIRYGQATQKLVDAVKGLKKK